MAGFVGPQRLLAAAAGVLLLAVSAAAQTEDNTRAVRIIEEAPPAAAPAVPGLPPPPALDAAPPPAVDAPPPPSGPVQAALAPMLPPDLTALREALKARNPAGVTVDILPGSELRVGEKLALRVASRKQGYLVLVDVDAEGRLTQIYPNRRSLLLAPDGQENVNLVRPGRPVTIPDIANPLAGFELVAAPPTGVAMVVAILSDRPVQMLDLPDVPSALVGRGGAIDYLTEWTSNLRIARSDGSGRLEQATWSFDAKLYVIR